MERVARIHRFETPDELREHSLGRVELLTVGGITVGRARYQPGWRWSEHVGAASGERWCMVGHVGLVLAGRNRVEMEDGRVLDLGPGDLFEIGPGHDSWVLGDEPYESIHLLGADAYART